MVRQPDADILGKNPGHGKDSQGGPTKRKQSRQRPQVKGADSQRKIPLKFTLLGLQGCLEFGRLSCCARRIRDRRHRLRSAPLLRLVGASPCPCKSCVIPEGRKARLMVVIVTKSVVY